MNTQSKPESTNKVRYRRNVERTQLHQIEGAVLDWLPGESLYSLIARNHFYRGHRLASHTIHAFFGSLTGKSFQPGMSEIDVFVARTEGNLGSAQQILSERTLMRFYRVFESSQRDDLDGHSQPSPDSILNFPLALKTGMFKAKHPLKGCPECLAKDAAETGFPYWRLAHQFPGVWVCLEHDQGLREVVPTSPRAQKFVWQTPTETALQDASDAFDHAGTFANLKTLTRLIMSITSENEHGVQRLAERAKQFREYLSDAWLLNPSGRLKVTRRHEVSVLCESFAAYCSVLRNHHRLSTLPGTTDEAFRLLTRYVFDATLAQPLERLVLTAWIDQINDLKHD